MPHSLGTERERKKGKSGGSPVKYSDIRLQHRVRVYQLRHEWLHLDGCSRIWSILKYKIPSRGKPTSARLRINIRTVRVASSLITNINLDLEFRAFGFASLDYVFFPLLLSLQLDFLLSSSFFFCFLGGSLPIKGFFVTRRWHRRSAAFTYSHFFPYDLYQNYVEL